MPYYQNGRQNVFKNVINNGKNPQKFWNIEQAPETLSCDK